MGSGGGGGDVVAHLPLAVSELVLFGIGLISHGKARQTVQITLPIVPCCCVPHERLQILLSLGVEK